MLSVTLPKKSATSIHRLAAIISPEKNQNIKQISIHLIEKIYKKHGVILLRGFQYDISDFKYFTSMLCSTSVLNNGPHRKTIDESHNIQTVNLGKNPFALHPELAREPWKPDVCFFACLIPPKEKGETLICDGAELVEKLPIEVRESFSQRTLRYTSKAHPEELLYWLGTSTPNEAELQNNRSKQCPFIFFMNPKKQIMRSFKTDTIHKTMYTKKPAFGNFLLFSRYNNKNDQFPTYGDFAKIPQELVEKIQLEAKKIQVALKWQKQDLLIIDNTRFMHGRNKVTNIQEREILSHFGFLRFAVLSSDEERLPWRKKSWHGRVPSNFYKSYKKYLK